MPKKAIYFTLLLLATLALVFCGHLYALHYKGLPLFDNKIILSYILNYVMAIVILVVVQRTIKKESAQGGFVFMAGSALKFIVFFLVFYPAYNSDDHMATVEFTSFFVPYAICLTLEVYYLSKELNNQSF